MSVCGYGGGSIIIISVETESTIFIILDIKIGWKGLFCTLIMKAKLEITEAAVSSIPRTNVLQVPSSYTHTQTTVHHAITPMQSFASPNNLH